MTLSAKQPSVLKKLIAGFERLYVSLSNQQRQRQTAPDYVLMQLPERMPALPEHRGLLRRRILGEPPLSLWEMDRCFRRIAADPRPKGVILHLRGFAMSLADLQTLRDSITRLREGGKQVYCFAQQYDLATYYVASAADEIIVQPGGSVFTVGLRQEAVFLKDTLEQIGVQVDSIAISPYKGAADTFTRSDISPEGREQLEWLLDSRFEQIVDGIAAGRGFSAEKVREVIDNAPYLDRFAKGIGVIDAVLLEEELPLYLGTKRVATWDEADKRLLLKYQSRHEKYVALLKIEGLMFPGESANPPDTFPVPVPVVEDGRVGDITVVRQVRALMQDDNLGAVVLFVDSGGGAALAAEAMRAALTELNNKLPVVVYMNGVAASGGYLVSTASRHIIAQPGTLTGSIGVILSKPVSGDLRDRLHIRAVEFLRGKNADILSTSKPFSEPQRAWLRESIERTYDLFVEQVARSRMMSSEAVDAVGGGRVWTGAQALEHGLVDELGGLRRAAAKARELAGLPDDTPMAVVSGKTEPLAPQVAETANPAAGLRYLNVTLSALLDGHPQLITPVTLSKRL
jgi:protease IV